MLNRKKIILGLATLGLFLILIWMSPSGCRVQKSQAVVQGESLRGELDPGDRVIVENGYFTCHQPKRGELAAFHYPRITSPIVKAIRGVPGDKIDLRLIGTDTYELLVNDQVLKTAQGEVYRFSDKRARMLGLYVRDYKGVIPADAYLLLGDVPTGSLDSSATGLFGRGALVARVQLRR